MKIGVQLERQFSIYGEKGALEVAAQAGFDTVDWSLHPQTDMFTCPLATNSMEVLAEHYRKLGEYAREFGLTVSQIHTPLAHAYRPEETAYNEGMYRMQQNSIACCAALGAKYAVMHVLQPPLEHYTPEYQALGDARNREFFQGLLPLLQKYDVQIAIENLFGITTLPSDDYDYSLTSRTQEMAHVIDMLNDMAGEERFVACVDTGHAILMGQDPAEMIRTLGKRVKVLHIHDNDGKHDQHLTPYMGKLHWDEALAALREIDYQGSFSFEADGFINVFDKLCQPEAMRFLARLGHHMTACAGL